MFDYPKVRKAPITDEQRATLNNLGEVGIQMKFTETFSRVGRIEEIGELISMAPAAQAYLIEKSDEQALREWWSRLVEWAVLIFVALEAIPAGVETVKLIHQGFSRLLHWFI
jgi:hypothetical protein